MTYDLAGRLTKVEDVDSDPAGRFTHVEDVDSGQTLEENCDLTMWWQLLRTGLIGVYAYLVIDLTVSLTGGSSVSRGVSVSLGHERGHLN